MAGIIELYLQHGWSFDASCWESWLDKPRQNWRWTVADRGYSGKSKVFPSYQHAKAFHLAVAHSFGLHLLPEDVLRQSNMLVILNGFRQFDPRAARGIRKMAAKLGEDPQSVLNDFRKNCFGDAVCSPGPGSPGPGSPQVELLQTDLITLSEQCLDISQLQAIPHILILHGEQDTVVRLEQAQKLHELLPNSKLHTDLTAQHALPFTHREWCLEKIVDTVDAMATPEELSAGLKS